MWQWCCNADDDTDDDYNKIIYNGDTKYLAAVRSNFAVYKFKKKQVIFKPF